MAFSSSTCLGLMSTATSDSPVMFPPGRAKLATNPLPTGSVAEPMTIGMVNVACCAAWLACVPAVTIRSTFSLTSSSARAGNRSLQLHSGYGINYCNCKDCLVDDISFANKHIQPRFAQFILGIKPAMATTHTYTVIHTYQYTEYMTF